VITAYILLLKIPWSASNNLNIVSSVSDNVGMKFN